MLAWKIELDPVSLWLTLLPARRDKRQEEKKEIQPPMDTDQKGGN
jgi:hypothetical protein